MGSYFWFGEIRERKVLGVLRTIVLWSSDYLHGRNLEDEEDKETQNG